MVKRKVFAALLLMIVLSMMALSVLAAKPEIFDDQNVFTAAQERQIDDALQTASERSGLWMFFGTVRSKSYEDANTLAEQFCTAHGIPCDGSENSVLLLYDPGRNRFEVFTYGKADDRISNEELNDIFAILHS